MATAMVSLANPIAVTRNQNTRPTLPLTFRGEERDLAVYPSSRSGEGLEGGGVRYFPLSTAPMRLRR